MTNDPLSTLRARMAELEAEVAALDWCREHLADIEFNQYFGEPPQVRVKLPVDLDGDEWREATARTLQTAVAALCEKEKPDGKS